MDTHCKVCNEPWDVWGLSHGDVCCWEADAIHKGWGCPSCDANGTQPSDKYVEPGEIVHFVCSSCGHSICTSPNEWIYDGDKKKYIGNNDTDNWTDNAELHPFICFECHTKEEHCDFCQKQYYLNDDPDELTYIQEMNALICEDCMQDGVISCCDSCQQNYRGEDLQKFEDGHYCPSCFEDKNAESRDSEEDPEMS